MNPLEEIHSFLKEYSDIQIQESSDSITVLSSELSGFDVSFKELKNGYIISFGEWHEYLPKGQKGANFAFGLFKFGLSDSCRLKIYRKGIVNYKCDLEYKKQVSGQWDRVATQSVFVYPFWKKEQVIYLKNSVITGDQFYDLFKGDDFEKVITEIKYERKYAKYYLIYTSIWVGLFFKLNDFDFIKIQVSIILFSPVIFVTLLLPLFVMRNWFDDRKLGKPKIVVLNKRQKRFLFL